LGCDYAHSDERRDGGVVQARIDLIRAQGSGYQDTGCIEGRLHGGGVNGKQVL
jgi:hypothetical protein